MSYTHPETLRSRDGDFLRSAVCGLSRSDLFVRVIKLGGVLLSPQLTPDYQLISYEFVSLTHFVFCLACSTHTSIQCFDLKSLMKLGSQSSLAIPKSLQHRIRAFDLQASVAVGTPDSSKYSCSPRAIETSLLIS
jgi:hypothetical protein